MSDGRRWRGGSGAWEEGETLWKPKMSAGVAVLRTREKKMGSPGLRENPEMEGMERWVLPLREMERSDPGVSASVESDDGDGVMGFSGDGFAA
ncbi:hypothetical protein MRB53_010059 [Persea americana]|uniref:Uncharacterized protein n=1 Tax=Persea americana TaxID=3435 RepID=A0ACC2LRS8_PERAE|nr:hypothetical protein MRB53_010059 [Persea americana]